jgi:ubiquinone/menaquinone biosynthesis C-methylase UbiE
MTPDMLTKARANAATGGYHNVEFRLGEIEHLPVQDDTVDAIISNCVINLSPEKDLVFGEAYRVLKPGGRLAIKDVVATAELPQEIKNDLELQAGCIAGAETIQNIEKILMDLGFQDISIGGADETRDLITKWTSASEVSDHLLSASIEAIKPV